MKLASTTFSFISVNNCLVLETCLRGFECVRLVWYPLDTVRVFKNLFLFSFIILNYNLCFLLLSSRSNKVSNFGLSWVFFASSTVYSNTPIDFYMVCCKFQIVLIYVWKNK